MDLILFILAGAGVGLAIGITGVGGGSLMTPLLILFGIPYHVAIGTDLLYAAFTKMGGALSHHRQRNIDWVLVRRLAAGSIPAAIATTFLLNFVFKSVSNYGPILTSSLGVMLILTSAVLLFKRRIETIKQADPVGSHAGWITVVSGVVLGVLVTLSSVGAGAFCAALLLVLYPHLPAMRVVGTDIAHAVPLTLVAGLGHWLFLGNVDWSLLACLLLGSLPAVHLGAKLGSRIPQRVLQPALATLLMGLGVKFAFF